MWRMIARASRLSWAEQRMVLEALATLATVRLVLGFLPFVKAMTLFGLRVRAADSQSIPGAWPEGNALPDAVGRALRRGVHIAPFRAVCLQQALAASIMLRRRGWPAEVHFGVARDGAGHITAHAWSVSQGTVVTGEQAMARQALIAIFEP